MAFVVAAVPIGAVPAPTGLAMLPHPRGEVHTYRHQTVAALDVVIRAISFQLYLNSLSEFTATADTPASRILDAVAVEAVKIANGRRRKEIALLESGPERLEALSSVICFAYMQAQGSGSAIDMPETGTLFPAIEKAWPHVNKVRGCCVIL